MKSIIARSPAMAGIVGTTHTTSASHCHGSLPKHDDFIRTAPQRVDLARTFRVLATDIWPPGKARRLTTLDRLVGCVRLADWRRARRSVIGRRAAARAELSQVHSRARSSADA